MVSPMYKYVCWTSVILGIMVLLSRITTYREWYGHVPKGVWKVVVRSAEGKPVTTAVPVVITHNGGILPFDRISAPDLIFDNYSTPGSLWADADGVITFRNTRYMGCGGESWRLLWLWNIDITSRCENKNNPFKIRIDATGYKSEFILYQDLIRSGSVDVVLERSDDEYQLFVASKCSERVATIMDEEAGESISVLRGSQHAVIKAMEITWRDLNHDHKINERTICLIVADNSRQVLKTIVDSAIGKKIVIMRHQKIIGCLDISGEITSTHLVFNVEGVTGNEPGQGTLGSW